MRHRRPIQVSQQLESIALADASVVMLAERELGAFSRAVKELFGAEQASLSTAEWIEELEKRNWPARPGVSDFRRITAAASARLAHRRVLQTSQEAG